MAEKFDVLNEMGLKTGEIATVDEVHKNGLWHRVVKVIVLNEKNQLLTQKRSKNKKLFPNVWDIAVTGHVSADELPIISAKREVFEELGLNIQTKDINYLFSYKKNIGYNNIKEKMFIDLFYIKSNIDLKSITILEDEVGEVQFIGFDEASEIINDDYFIEKEELDNILNCLKRISYDN